MLIQENGLTSCVPPVRGRITLNAPLAQMTWFRVGGAADVLFKPADLEDLQAFLKACPKELPVMPLGVASNLLIRDGGIEGVVLRLGGAFAGITPVTSFPRKRESSSSSEDNQKNPDTADAALLDTRFHGHDGLKYLHVGAAALDANIALVAQQAGIAGLEFLSGIPGTLGGAFPTNAGCYGRELKDILVSARAVDREGNLHTLTPESLNLTYRHADLPDGFVVVDAVLRGTQDDPEAIAARMEDIRQKREASQPIRTRTGGSTFANPDGTSAWKVVDAAGCRGLRLGGAMVSDQHCNFLINTGTATATELEDLGELVRQKVKIHSGTDLRWEIRRIGRRKNT